MRLIFIFCLLPVIAQPAWKAGVAKVSITPSQPIWMAGYDARTKPSEGVLQDIDAKALALQDDSGATTVLVTIDLVGVAPSITDGIVERARKLGIARERLLLNASHTHSAPAAGEEWVQRFEDRVSPAQVAVVRAYTRELVDKVSGVIAESVRNLAPAQLSFGQGLAGVAVNRRRVANRSWPGPVDHDVPVLAVRGANGNLRAVVFGYACHNTTLGDYQISGDWAGFAMGELEKQSPGAIALFVQGAGADANPLPRRTVELAVRHGQTVAAAVSEVLQGKMKQVNGALRAVYEITDVPFQKPPSREELTARLKDTNEARRRNAGWLLAALERDGHIRSSYPDPIQVWQFGDGPTLIALGGELVVDYALRFKAKYGWSDTWIAGYSNDVFGYVPSRRVLKEGGYEGGDALLYRPFPGPFAPEIEENIASKVDELVRKVRRP
jgi:Neutral/alkaline non-lysosomal ceramidase, N-terminal